MPGLAGLVQAVHAARRRGPLTLQAHTHQVVAEDDLVSAEYQLHREYLFERLSLEYRLRKSMPGMFHFGTLIVAFLWTVWIYDPLYEVSAVHESLRVKYQMDSMDQFVDTPSEVLAYISSFIDVTYSMASALIDANTMNQIDPNRCFSDEVNDICRLKYWEVQARRTSDPHYVNLNAIFQDEVSLDNYDVSKKDCRVDPDTERCINWTQRANPNLSIVMGLTPEDPVILQKKKNFPFAQVVPLAPLIYQTRSPKVPCSGFGDTYNQEVLGASSCTPDVRCDPGSVTSFESPKPNRYSGRLQELYVTYESDAVACFDRSREEDVFYDKSWDPWASYADFVQGRRLEAVELLGKQVFYKFISDSSYLQAPIKGTVYVNKSDPCQPCAAWALPDCVDPVEEGRDHPMWQEVSVDDECSVRRQFNLRYLDPELTSDRESTFFDMGTKELHLSALVITPQMKGVPDITTLVEVAFTIGQSGVIDAEPRITSISETKMVEWCVLGVITVLLALTFPLHGTVKPSFSFESTSRRTLCLNWALALSICAYVAYNMYLEFSPPHVLEELKNAFQANQQSAYFDSFRAILVYSENLKRLKNIGFNMVIIAFFRLLHLLDVHPRLGLVSKVSVECADDVFHFLIQFGIVFGMLSFLAYWSFSDSTANFGTLSKSYYTLFRFFTGDFAFENEVPPANLVLFLTIYVFVVFVMMVNFLLAIVVNAHTKVTTEVETCLVEQNFVMDMWDMVLSAYQQKARGWPPQGDIMEHLRGTAEGRAASLEDMPAVTARELRRATDSSGIPLFGSEAAAQCYIDYYATKICVSDDLVLLEKRKDKRFLKGHSLWECDDFPSEKSMEIGIEDGFAVATDKAGGVSVSVQSATGSSGVVSRRQSPGRPAKVAGTCSLVSRLLAGGGPSLEELTLFSDLPPEEQLEVEIEARGAYARAFSEAVHRRRPPVDEGEGSEDNVDGTMMANGPSALDHEDAEVDADEPQAGRSITHLSQARSEVHPFTR